MFTDANNRSRVLLDRNFIITQIVYFITNRRLSTKISQRIFHYGSNSYKTVVVLYYLQYFSKRFALISCSAILQTGRAARDSESSPIKTKTEFIQNHRLNEELCHKRITLYFQCHTSLFLLPSHRLFKLAFRYFVFTVVVCPAAFCTTATRSVLYSFLFFFFFVFVLKLYVFFLSYSHNLKFNNPRKATITNTRLHVPVNI